MMTRKTTKPRWALGWRLLLCSALACAGPLAADQNDPQLDTLFARLQKLRDATAAAPVEQQIWQIWVTHENPALQEQMNAGIRALNGNRLQQALTIFNQLISQAPDWAEAWNKRATLHYLLGNHEESMADIEQVLQREPFHFGAMSGLGLVNLAQGNYFAAHRAFQRLLEVYPAMPGVRDTLAELDARLGRQSI